MAEHPGDGLALKQVEVVFQRRAEPLGCFHQGEGQIELGSAAVHVDRLQLQPRQLPRCHRRVLQHEHDLEKGIAAEGSFRLQFLHQFLERQILMSKCAERVFAHTPKQSAKRRVACQVTAENQRVDEETNQILQIQLVSACDDRADQDVFLVGVTVQKRLEGRQQSHEKGDALLTGQVFERLGQRRWKLKRFGRAAQALHRRTRPVRRQIEDRKGATQLFSPVSQLAFQRRTPERVPFPECIVGVLDGQLRQRRRRSGAERVVKGGEFAEENAD